VPLGSSGVAMVLVGDDSPQATAVSICSDARLIAPLMFAGDWWFEAFAVPRIAAEAPEVLGLSPSWSVLVGAIATVVLYSVGWTLFGLAVVRARVFPRAAACWSSPGSPTRPTSSSTSSTRCRCTTRTRHRARRRSRPAHRPPLLVRLPCRLNCPSIEAG
jgi:hypothetical protein